MKPIKLYTMKRIIIIPDHDKVLNKRYEKQGRLGYTYLHGQLEEDCGFDCYNIANPEEFGFIIEDSNAKYASTLITPKSSQQGLIKCQYKRKPCTLFLWMDNFRDHFHGLVVYDFDKESYAYAEKCYNNKESCI